MKYRLYLNDKYVKMTGIFQSKESITAYLTEEGYDSASIAELFSNGEMYDGDKCYSITQW